jgi:hypothetical protein
MIKLLYETYTLYKHMRVVCMYLAHANDIFVYIEKNVLHITYISLLYGQWCFTGN